MLAANRRALHESHAFRASSPMTASLAIESYLQVRSAAGGSFSPDGASLAFLMNATGTAQVFRLDRAGGEPRQLTASGEIVRSVHWSPNGSRLLFAMDEGGSERHQLYLVNPDGSGLRLLTPFPGAIHTFGAWSPDGRRIAFAANRRSPEFFDVHVLDLETGEDRTVLAGEGNYTPVDWSADARSILVRESRTGFEEDLHLLDPESGLLRCVTPGGDPARYPCARFLPDGRSLLVCTDHDRDFLALCRIDTRLGRLRRLLERRADIESCDVSADGQRVCALLNRDGWSEVVTARLTDRSLARVVDTPLRGVAADCRLSRDGTRIALTLNSPAQNQNVWEMDPDSGARVQWTRAPMGDLNAEELVPPEAVRFPAHDGLQIPAFFYPPRAAGAGPSPAVVHVHGGPESQDRPNFSPVYQYLAARGFAVLAPNVRGSSGYGKAYSRMDDREKRVEALEDVASACRWLAGSGRADPRRIAIMGASYGGFTVLACLTRQPELWAAGVDIVGIANFETFFRHTGPWRRRHRAGEYGDPVHDAALLRELSPIHAVDRIRAPLMVIQGANDPRVPQEESDQIVERLRARGRPVEYLLFPDEGHGIVKLPNRIRAYTAVAAFLERHLAP